MSRSNDSSKAKALETAKLSKRRPGFKLRDLERVVFRGNRMRCHESVDAFAVGVQRLAHRLRQQRQGLLGSAPQAERTKLNVIRPGGGTDELGERPAGLLAQQVHLEQP